MQLSTLAPETLPTLPFFLRAEPNVRDGNLDRSTAGEEAVDETDDAIDVDDEADTDELDTDEDEGEEINDEDDEEEYEDDEEDEDEEDEDDEEDDTDLDTATSSANDK